MTACRKRRWRGSRTCIGHARSTTGRTKPRWRWRRSRGIGRLPSWRVSSGVIRNRSMRLPFAPPLAPMLSRAADALPAGEGWQFEPKWDGFRTLVFRDGDEILLQSRDEKTMNRYFPELIAPLAATLSERCVIDGEIVIVGGGGLDFEALLLRIHPAASRVKLLSAPAPASFVAWDLLALGDDALRNAPLAVRRERLEHVLAGAAPPVHLSPATRDR